MINSFRTYGPWGEHPDHPVSDWKAEVANDDTRLGYWAWIAARVDAQTTPEPPHRPH
ncbi:hypothetical protein [Rhizorhabdus histidinilytica]|uniref:hypothetical protein n=1 Tax=Rhizorhabdus histidinilytica TaxID=439228 RepID=UPI001ADB0E67|nr:hypothetical protein [Rhizorhabdus histidinilytica]